MKTIAAILFGGALVWAAHVYGATETQNHHRVFLLCLIPTLLVAWTVVPSRHSILFACLGLVLILNISVRPTLEAEGYVVAALGWMALFVVVELSAYSAGATRRFALLVVMIGAAEAVYGLLQYFGELPDSRGFISGTLVNRNHFAALLNMSIAVAIGLTFGGFSRRVRTGVSGTEVRAWGWLIVLACALMGLAVLLSGSRAATLTLIATLLFLCLMLAVKQRTRRGTTLPTAYTSILLVTILGLALWVGAGALSQRFAEVESGLADRAAISAASLQLIGDHPWAGVGPGMYRWRFRPYQPGSANVWYDHAHNDYLQVAAEWGLPVALAFWGFVLWSFLASARFFLTERRDTGAQAISLGCTGALLSILLHSTVDFNLQIPSNLMMFCTVLGLSFAVRLRPQEVMTS
jgi:putative inorganic carbon (hco3(-)) transporter